MKLALYIFSASAIFLLGYFLGSFLIGLLGIPLESPLATTYFQVGRTVFPICVVLAVITFIPAKKQLKNRS